ncbi:DNA mismatch repair protein Pms1/Pms2, partial [Kipferlia bialata]|eukprot:g8179.t1
MSQGLTPDSSPKGGGSIDLLSLLMPEGEGEGEKERMDSSGRGTQGARERERERGIQQMGLDESRVISASQVIVAPWVVVKELLDNALDSGATHITVSLANSGVDSISVSDDGSGIEESAFEYLITHRATSKLPDTNAISEAETLGFRGEALYSLASIANLK